MARELTPATTLGAYGAGLALVFVAALGVGRAVGPVGAAEDTQHRPTHSIQETHGGAEHGSTEHTGTETGTGTGTGHTGTSAEHDASDATAGQDR